MKRTQYTDKSTGETLTRTVNEYGIQSYRNAYGKLHRTDGPAVIDGDRLEWWADGKEYTEAEFNELTAKEVEE